MRSDRMVPKAAFCFSLLLGQASLLLGLMLALGWAFAFALIAPHLSGGALAGPQSGLPVGLPLIGLALGMVGLLVARWFRQPVARFAVAGLIFNAIPLVLAVVLVALSAAR